MFNVSKNRKNGAKKKFVIIFERFDILKMLKLHVKRKMRSNAIKNKVFFNEILRYTWSVIGADILLNQFSVITLENLMYQKISAPIIVNIF